MSSKILIVEDNQDTRELLHHFFTNAQFTAVTAADGVEGLYLAKAEKPDLIIIDYAMPEMSGGEVVKQLRADENTANIPILIYTAYYNVPYEELLNAGADKVFYKPLDFEEMITTAKEMLLQLIIKRQLES
jgi:CheY-like chemotaxis protein